MRSYRAQAHESAAPVIAHGTLINKLHLHLVAKGVVTATWTTDHERQKKSAFVPLPRLARDCMKHSSPPEVSKAHYHLLVPQQ